MNLPELTLGGVSLLVIIEGVVWAAKKTELPSRWLPAVASGVGVLLGLAVWLADGVTLPTALVGGFLTGLSVAGGYDFVKKTVLNK